VEALAVCLLQERPPHKPPNPAIIQVGGLAGAYTFFCDLLGCTRHSG
jgi:hypothetical protein